MIIRSSKQFDAIKDSIEKQGYKIIETDNLYEKEGAGYKHIALKLVKQDGDKLVKELLLMRPNMLEAKFGLGHDLYDLEKNVEIILPKLKEKGADYFGMVGLDVIRHYSKQFYEYDYLKDLEDEQKFYSPLTLERTSSKPSRIPPRSKLRKSSSDLAKRLVTVLKSDLGKAVWRPIRAKLKASSNDISPFNAGSSNKEDIADLILSSIVDPFMKVHDKYSKSLKTNVINRQTNSKINLL
jgi:hypothetical protein